MLNSYWLIVPFALQALLMAVDELRFHRRRGLPRWERIGHPLDTLTVAVCLAWILFTQPNHRTVIVFFAMAVFSCVFVTKDEPVHRRCCSAAEMWLHAFLFILHPVTLAIAGIFWSAMGNGSPALFAGFVRFSGFERTFLTLTCAFMVLFGIYQFVFWNLAWQPKKTT
jgi:hypothetical protein